MSISCNKELEEIVKIFQNDKLEKNYRVFIDDKKFYHISIICHISDTEYVNMLNLVYFIRIFLNNNGLIVFEDYKKHHSTENLIEIGFNKELLTNESFCKCMLKTLIYGFEKIIKFEKKFIYNRKISNMPYFKI